VARRKRKKDRAKRVRIVSIAEMMEIRNQLERVSRPGTDPLRQAAVLTLAMQYMGAYYKTGKGTLRRVFPKASESVLFEGVGRPIQKERAHEQAG
jgi:hypothetical protein